VRPAGFRRAVVPSLLRAPVVLQQVLHVYLLQALQRLLADLLWQYVLHRLLPLHGVRRPAVRPAVRPDVWPPLLTLFPALLPGPVWSGVHEWSAVGVLVLSVRALRRVGVVQQHRLL
jgi:hypothetical protein